MRYDEAELYLLLTFFLWTSLAFLTLDWFDTSTVADLRPADDV